MSQTANSSPADVSAEPSSHDSVPTAESTATLKHPLGLYVLFGTEMWERFCYYGMRALLVLFLVEHHGWQPSEANGVFKWYTSLVYLTPLMGGFLADRYLGLRPSIALGGTLMGIGAFFLTQEPLPIFYLGLGLLILGNGFFKPNITTLVGRMYVPGDERRDRAFTIFYMGINMGGLLGPIICGQWLRAHYGFNYGFGATGVAMIFSLLIFVGFRKQVERDVLAAGNTLGKGASVSKESAKARQDERDEGQPAAKGLSPAVGRAFIMAMGVLFGMIIPAYFISSYVKGDVPISGLFMPVAVAVISVLMTVNLLRIKGASRDKSLVIFILFVFQLLFWMAFEQAGNSLTLWAAFHTQREMFSFNFEPELYQTVNGIFIVILAPVLAWVWLRLNRIGREPSTPMKMAFSMVFIGLSSFAMIGATVSENATETHIPAGEVPAGIDLTKFDAGRLSFDKDKHEIVVKGVLPSFVVNDLLKQSSDPKYVESIESFVRASSSASAEHPVSAKIEGAPSDYTPLGVLAAAGATWNSGALTVTKPIDPPARVALLSEGAPSEWRTALRALAGKSDAARVAGYWLFLSYLLATIGELCISPVGYSMVTKLAPTRFASLFMAVWLLSNSVAQYIGGSIGEAWGKVAPTNYFMIFVASSAVGAILLCFLVRPVQKLMHEVR